MTTTRNHERAGTASRVLDAAEVLVQTRGYNGFSYADVAAELGITTASLHYHFPGKAELGVALIRRYGERFAAALESIEQTQPDEPGKLRDFARLYINVLRQGRMCLCGMLAADYETLPPPMRVAVVEFFDENEAWLAKVLEHGREQGELRFAGPAIETARTLMASLEGTMLVARPYADPQRFEQAAAQLLDTLAGVSSA